MNHTTDTRDRVIRLEAEVEAMAKTIEGMDRKVSEMHTLLQQAKGVRWAILAMAAMGGFISAKLGGFIPGLPR